MLRTVTNQKRKSFAPSPLTAWLLCAALLWLLALPAGGQNAGSEYTQAVIEFDGVVIGDTRGGYTITGNVRFTYEDIYIEADEMSVDADGEVAEFSGNVIVETEEQTFYGDRFVYDIPAGTSLLFRPSGILEAENIEGPVYFRGETMAIEQDRIILTDAMFTTCHCESPDKKPGYYIAGTHMEIIPGRAVIIRNVRFVESGLTLFYWPVLTLPLVEQDRPPFQLPQVGHSARDGWFIKASIPYGLAAGVGGFIHMDWFQYTGYGLGATHYYRDDETGSGQVHLYGLANRWTGTIDPTIGWSGRYSGGVWNNSWDIEYEESGWVGNRQQDLDGSFSIQNRRPDGQITLRGTYSGTRTPTSDTHRLTGALRLNQRLWGSTQLTFNADTSLWQGTTRDRRLVGYRFDLSNRSGPIRWSLVTEESFNQELTKDEPPTTVPWRTLTRRPEIVVGTDVRVPVFGRNFPLNFEVTYGDYTERQTSTTIVRDKRTSALMQLRSTSIPLGSQLTLSVGGYARGYWYGNSDSRLVLSSNYTATYRPTSRVTLQGRYEYLDESGFTPFRFDRITPRERLTGSVQYRTANLNVTVSSAYDLIVAEPDDVTLSLNATPFPETRVRLQSVYSLRDNYMDYVAGTVEVGDGKPVAVKIGGKYSFLNNELERLDGSIRLQLSGWNLEYGAIYDVKRTDPFHLGRLTVLRDLDCRQVGLSYDFVDRSFWIEYRITAIPNLGVRVGAEEDEFIFNLEGWQELISE